MSFRGIIKRALAGCAVFPFAMSIVAIGTSSAVEPARQMKVVSPQPAQTAVAKVQPRINGWTGVAAVRGKGPMRFELVGQGLAKVTSARVVRRDGAIARGIETRVSSDALHRWITVTVRPEAITGRYQIEGLFGSGPGARLVAGNLLDLTVLDSRFGPGPMDAMKALFVGKPTTGAGFLAPVDRANMPFGIARPPTQRPDPTSPTGSPQLPQGLGDSRVGASDGGSNDAKAADTDGSKADATNPPKTPDTNQPKATDTNTAKPGGTSPSKETNPPKTESHTIVSSSSDGTSSDGSQEIVDQIVVSASDGSTFRHTITHRRDSNGNVTEAQIAVLTDARGVTTSESTCRGYACTPNPEAGGCTSEACRQASAFLQALSPLEAAMRERFVTAKWRSLGGDRLDVTSGTRTGVRPGGVGVTREDALKKYVNPNPEAGGGGSGTGLYTPRGGTPARIGQPRPVDPQRDTTGTGPIPK